eukprot:IDg6395t1
MLFVNSEDDLEYSSLFLHGRIDISPDSLREFRKLAEQAGKRSAEIIKYSWYPKNPNSPVKRREHYRLEMFYIRLLAY